MADLDLPRIAVAALAVIDEHGNEGFTMRAVADALGVTPMALYHHVEDKAALADLVVELVMRERPLPTPAGAGWREELWQMACWARETTLAHPAVLQLRREYQVFTPAMFAMAERWGGIWQQSGLPFERAVVAARTSSIAIFAAAEAELLAQGRRFPEIPDLSMFPNVRAQLAVESDPDAEFEVLVHAVIDGLHARLADR